jgi:hypothetical protein
MAKKRSNRRRSMRGGDGAAENALKVAGDGNQQWDNVFKGSGNTSNALVPLNKAGGSRRRKRGGGAPVAPTHHHGSSGPDVSKGPVKGGSRRRRGKKGGFWGSIINRAIVPFGILGLQQTYRRRKSGGTKRRRH